MSFRLAVSAEMVFTELPFEERVRRIDGLGFEVEIWDWTTKDLPALAATGARFGSMTGYVRGALVDPDGAAELLRTAEDSLAAAEVLDKQMQAKLEAARRRNAALTRRVEELEAAGTRPSLARRVARRVRGPLR